MSRTHDLLAPAAVLAAAIVIAANAGDLDPPGGPPAPTMKTLDLVEPRTPLVNDFTTLTPIVIDQPGSYYLAENITALPDQHGIEITCSDVSLDLNGFTVYGNTEVGSLDGIHVAFTERNVIIRNGIVRDFFQSGINADVPAVIIRDVIAYNNGLGSTDPPSYPGIDTGDHTVADACIAIANARTGLNVGGGSVMTRCVADNGGDGLFNVAGVIADSVGSMNDADGMQSNRGVITGSVGIGNDREGINSGSGTAVTGCAAYGNGMAGFGIPNSLIAHCVSWDNDGLAIEGVGGTAVDNHAP